MTDNKSVVLRMTFRAKNHLGIAKNVAAGFFIDGTYPAVLTPEGDLIGVQVYVNRLNEDSGLMFVLYDIYVMKPGDSLKDD